MGRDELKNLLLAIKGGNYLVPEGRNPYELSIEMMNYIGDTDPELRDDLILSNLSNWIVDGVLSKEEVKHLLFIALDEQHLFKGMGNQDDTVFCRTFSALVVALAVYRHRTDAFLTETQLKEILQKVLTFYHEDKDVRGYIDEKGWAHGAAHGADALDELARCSEIMEEDLLLILNSIYHKVIMVGYGYIHFEEERMITAVKAVLERKMIPQEKLISWIRSFLTTEKTGANQEDLVMEFNLQVFLKSLYFRLVDHPEYELITAEVKDVLMQVNRFNKM